MNEKSVSFMAPLTLLHLSDLHWSPGSAADLEIVSEALFEDLERLATDGVHPDLIIFSGDLALAGDDAEMLAKAWEAFIIPLSERSGVPIERIFVAPGNHDISRQSVRDIPSIESTLQGKLRATGEINKFIDDSSTPSSEAQLALKRVENFYLAHDCHHSEAISSTPYYRTFRVVINDLTIGVACFNSAWRATGEKDDVDYGRLIIGERAIDNALGDLGDCDYRVAVHHHPLDWLVPADRQSSDLLLRRQFDLSCCGHMHVAKPTTTQTPSGTCVVSQSGSVYAGRGWFNGYNVISVDLPTRAHKFYVRAYFDERRRFDRATSICDDGIVLLPGNLVRDTRRSDKIELFLRGNRDLLRSRIADHINIVGSGDLTADQLIRQFVVPPIIKPEHFHDGMTAKQDRDKTYSVNDLLDIDENILIVGDRQSGKTSLAYFIAHEIACRRLDSSSIPVFINLSDHKFNKYGLGRAVRNFYDEIPAGFDVDTAISEGLFCFIVDNLPTSGEEMQRFADHAAQFKECKWIAFGTPNVDGVSPDRLFNEHLGEFEKFHVRELSRAGIRAAARTWSGGSEDEASTIYDAVMRQLVRDGLPRTPYMVSLLVWTIKQRIGRQHLNESMLLENIVDHLIGKADFRLSVRNKLSPLAKEITLQDIAHFMFERDGIAAENDVLGHLLEFFSAKKLPFIASDVLDKLVSCGILARQDDCISFKYPCFQEYFFAKKLGANRKLLGHFLADLNFLNVRRELELLAGLRQQNDDIIEAIAALLAARVPDRFNDRDVNDFVSGQRASLKVGTTQAQLNRIKKNRLSSAQFDEMMDEADRRALSRGERKLSDSVERAGGDLATAAREREAEAIASDELVAPNKLQPSTHMAAIDILARVIRNSDFTDYDVKGPATRMVLESWIKIYLLILEEVEAMFAAIGAESGDPLEDDERAMTNYLVAKMLFSIVGASLVAHISSPSISETIKEIMKDSQLSIGERLLVLFLLEDASDSAWQDAWSELIADKDQPGFVLECVINRLFVITHTKALEDDQAGRIKDVVHKIEQRLGWTPDQRNALIDQVREAANLAALKDLSSETPTA